MYKKFASKTSNPNKEPAVIKANSLRKPTRNKFASKTSNRWRRKTNGPKRNTVSLLMFSQNPIRNRMGFWVIYCRFS
jgi:hypothetical protein